VRVVAACVHHADGFTAKLRCRCGLERHVGLLRDRQSVHIRAQSNGASRLGAAQEADDSRQADTGPGFDAQRAQMPGDLFCGTQFPVAELRVRVEVAAPFDGLWLDGFRCRVELGARDPAAGCLGQSRQSDGQEKSGQSAAHTMNLRKARDVIGP
jgi:hypothetical protein